VGFTHRQICERLYMTHFARNAAIGLVVASVAGGGVAGSADAALWALFYG
jgi:hypothetical protein